jgi:flagellar biogenesis protein FliO
MSAGKIKVVAILAAFIPAGMLLLTVARATDAPSPIVNGVATEEGQQATDATTDGQSGVFGGREFYYKMLLSVSLVAGLGIAAIFILKKVLPRISNLPGKQIRVVETAYIAPRKGIHLIQIGARRLLIASTNETITMLSDVTDSAGDFVPPTGGFAAELEKRS